MQQVAFTTALIVAYGRAFTKSDGWPDIPRRLVPYDEKDRELHDRLMEMRHTVYAHSDSKVFNIRLITSERGWPRSIDKLPSLRLSAEETALFMTMTAKLSRALQNRCRELYEDFSNRQKATGGLSAIGKCTTSRSHLINGSARPRGSQHPRSRTIFWMQSLNEALESVVVLR
jgi:hypothetical protein